MYDLFTFNLIKLRFKNFAPIKKQKEFPFVFPFFLVIIMTDRVRWRSISEKNTHCPRLPCPECLYTQKNPNTGYTPKSIVNTEF